MRQHLGDAAAGRAERGGGHHHFLPSEPLRGLQVGATASGTATQRRPFGDVGTVGTPRQPSGDEDLVVCLCHLLRDGGVSTVGSSLGDRGVDTSGSMCHPRGDMDSGVSVSPHWGQGGRGSEVHVLPPGGPRHGWVLASPSWGRGFSGVPVSSHWGWGSLCHSPGDMDGGVLLSLCHRLGVSLPGGWGQGHGRLPAGWDSAHSVVPVSLLWGHGHSGVPLSPPRCVTTFRTGT